ncbi:histidine kinase [Acaricomes phytoseiuli]|uniref:histidine kinase n=1 Tax=Acaricomes phytoseiuli TaxID=291968 RepID=UPI000477D0D0|nr:histidine kinase [Acaricomes phytoseiuli]MCW1249798.1 histidine kinase [Acaricomes phytoseiuli]
MPSEPLSPLAAMLLSALGVIALAGFIGAGSFIGFRLSRPHRELGDGSEHGAYRALHAATLAGSQLRDGLRSPGAPRAAKHLRTMLGCQAVAITNVDQVLAWEEPGGSGAESIDAGALLSICRKTLDSGRLQVLRLQGREQASASRLKTAVIAPIRVDARIVGSFAAFQDETKNHPSAAFLRAVEETAEWIAGQLLLAELSDSRTLLMEAELRSLRAQISPHFIYNSLNAISAYVISDPERARELLVEFADFTRYSFRQHGDFTTLAEELRSIDRYLLLERARFGERLNVSLEIGPEVLSTAIPFLSLQPLVENAVRHGIEAKNSPGLLRVTAHDAGPYAQITVEDDGIGMDPALIADVLAGQAEGDHVGLRNVDARLRQVYGDEHGLIIDTGPGAGTLITLRVPKYQPEHLIK